MAALSFFRDYFLTKRGEGSGERKGHFLGVTKGLFLKIVPSHISPFHGVTSSFFPSFCMSQMCKLLVVFFSNAKNKKS